jgi:hypothetical protein
VLGRGHDAGRHRTTVRRATGPPYGTHSAGLPNAFGLGDTDKAIAGVDADRVALAAVQSILRRTVELRRDNAELRAMSSLERAGRCARCWPRSTVGAVELCSGALCSSPRGQPPRPPASVPEEDPPAIGGELRTRGCPPSVMAREQPGVHLRAARSEPRPGPVRLTRSPPSGDATLVWANTPAARGSAALRTTRLDASSRSDPMTRTTPGVGM